MKLWSCCLCMLLFVCNIVLGAQNQEVPANPGPDVRYKVDILIVVGHPDDDIEVASYVAKLIEQEHKKVAVVYTTRGNSGGNAAGLEQASALSDVREMEARHSIGSYGITNAWFLHGADVPGGDDSRVIVTIHPSYLLRLRDDESKEREYKGFVADLRRCERLLKDVE